jgi:glycosyltransferase involved in cell wall biosynthesis
VSDRHGPVRVGFVVHVMQMAGAERLVVETIRRLGDRIRPTVFCLDAIGLLGTELQRDNVDVVVLGRRPGLDLPVARRLSTEIARRGIAVVHAHQYTPFFYAALAKLLRLGRVRLILTEHGRHFPDIVSGKRRLVNSLLLSRLADRVNAVCAFSADALATNDGFARDRIEVIPNGMEVGEYEHLERASDLGVDRRYVTCIARFHPVKDHATLLRGFASVAAAFPDVDLVLAGDGPLRQDLDTLAQTLGISGRVRFLGVRRDVPSILKATTVFCLTSVSEAASLTVLEAMAAGVPVVLTKVGGNPELVQDGVHGLLVPRADAAAVGAALTTLLNDSRYAARLASAAAQRVRREFLLETTVARYHALYEALAEAQTSTGYH